MLRALNLFMTEMIRVIEEYGGSVEKNTGDGLLAYFDETQASQTGANSTKKALACALTMSAANDLLIAPVLRATDLAPFQIRLTLEYGPITVARIGPPRRFNANVAIGNAANFASKALGWIKPGEIALGAAAAGRIPPAWFNNFTSLSPVSTGWVYSQTDMPYPLYLYTGRWNKLV
jgi:adenylate cyclase